MSAQRVLVAVAAMLALAWGAKTWHDHSVRDHPILPVAFEHLDHQNIQCTDCHHNYIDDTGHDSCYSCHKHDDSVALEIETMFHDFCRGCHETEAQKGHVSGPFRVCKECHNDSGRMASQQSLMKF
ncbi:MAG: cytochrome c3 family protein [Pseudomonadota bacterium]